MAVWRDVQGWVTALLGRQFSGCDKTELYKSAPPLTDPLNAGLEGAAAHILGPAVTKSRLIVVADPSSQILEHVPWLDRFTVGVELCNSLSDAKSRSNHFVEKSIILIDVDCFVDLEAAVDALRQLRLSSPNTPIVIGSTTFSRPDFSGERSFIADASIRFPAPGPQVALALGAAVTNHRARTAVDHRRAETSLSRPSSNTVVPTNTQTLSPPLRYH